MEPVQAEGGNPQAAAEYLGISRHLVTAALDYYANYLEEVDRWIERNATLADDVEAAWRRRHDNAITT